jgi:hypothetical protein
MIFEKVGGCQVTIIIRVTLIASDLRAMRFESEFLRIPPLETLPE